MADHHHLQPVGVVAFRLDVNLRDQRAGRIDIDHLPRLGGGGDGFWHAVGREDDWAVVGAVGQFLDEDRALVAQVIDHELVVHDLVADIDRRAPFLDRHFDDLDRPVDARAKAARRGEVKGEGRLGHRGLLVLGSEVRPASGGVQRRGGIHDPVT